MAYDSPKAAHFKASFGDEPPAHDTALMLRCKIAREVEACVTDNLLHLTQDQKEAIDAILDREMKAAQRDGTDLKLSFDYTIFTH